MKRSTSILWGIALIVGGSIFALNTLGITHINLFFTGWWTLFIIVPCAVGLFTEKNKGGNLIGIAFGVFLLLCARDILEFEMIWKLFLPALIVFAGVRLVFSALFRKKKKAPAIEVEINIGSNGSNTAVFSGSELNFADQAFTGTDLTAVFGGIDCDLRKAIIKTDCRINVTAVFGGIDIYMPDNVNVVTNITGIFGGADSTVPSRPDSPTVYIDGTCIFGGVDIK